MNCVSLSGLIIFRYEKFMCIFSFFRKIKIERNTKLKLIAYILGITCYKMSLIEAPKLVSIKQKRKKEKSCRRWTDHFSTHCTYLDEKSVQIRVKLVSISYLFLLDIFYGYRPARCKFCPAGSALKTHIVLLSHVAALMQEK